MADRINSYKLLRTIHLYSALIVMVFVTMYFLTGFLLTRYSWFDQESPEPETQEIPLDRPIGNDPEEISIKIQELTGIGGKRYYPRKLDNGSNRFEYIHPGRRYVAVYDPGKMVIKLETYQQNAYQVVSAFHRIHKYGGGFIYDIYVAMMDLTSLALLVFVVSGIYLWFKVLKNKWFGLFLLIAGVGYSIWVFLTFLSR